MSDETIKGQKVFERLTEYNAVGFDLDYCVVTYTPHMQQAIIDTFLNDLNLHFKYPSDIIKFKSEQKHQPYSVFDIERGNII